MKKLSSVFFACMVFLFFACEEEPAPDVKAPAIEITSPTEGDQFSQQDDLTIEAAVSDDSALESVSLSITPPGGSAQVVHVADKESFTNGNRELNVSRTLPLSMGGGLAEGTYILTVNASDVHGNTSHESISIFIEGNETEAPAIAINSPTEGGIFNPGEDIPVKAATEDNSGLREIKLIITPPAGGSPVTEVQNFADSRKQAGFDTSLKESFSLEPGDYLIAVEAIDMYGNKSQKSVTASIRQADTQAPALSISNPTEGREFNSDDVISIEARATDNTGLEAYTIRLTPPGGETQVVLSKDFSANSTEGNIWETIRLDAGAPAGNYVISIEVTDVDENATSQEVSVSVKVPDSKAPQITIGKPAEGASFTTEEEIPVEASLADDSGLASARIFITPSGGQAQEVYAETFTASPAATTLSQSISLAGMSATGTYLLTVEATDIDGHTRDKTVNVMVREPDHAAPTVAISAPLAGAEFYANKAIQLKANATDNAALAELSVWVSSPAGETTRVHTVDPANFFNNNTEAAIDEAIGLGTENPAPGTYLIRVLAMDAAGNEAENKVSINLLEADETAPTITVNSPATGSTYVHGEEVKLDALVEDNQKLAEIRVTIMLENSLSMYDNTITEFDSDTRHQLLDTLSIPTDAPLGTYYVTITATDAAGNTTEEELTFQLVEEA